MGHGGADVEIARTYMEIKDYLDGRDGRKAGGQGGRRRDDQDEDRPDPRTRRNKGGQAPNGRSLPGPRHSHIDSFRKFSAFTPLNTPQERILALHRDKLGSPAPVTKDPAKQDRSKFCEYHQDHGHLTSECYQLKHQIEALKLKEYVLRTIETATAGGEHPRQERKGQMTVTVTDRTANDESESS